MAKRRSNLVETNEKLRNLQDKRKQRESEAYRSQEKERDRTAHAAARESFGVRRSERIRDKIRHRLIRENAVSRQSERERDCERRALARQNPTKRKDEFDKIASQQKLRRQEQGWDDILSEFRKEICKMPFHPCSSCGCTYYEDSVTSYKLQDFFDQGLSEEFVNQVICIHRDSVLLCGTCKRYVLKKKVPKLNLSNGFRFPEQPPELKVCLFILLSMKTDIC